jgi:ATP-dependent RNA helicase DHX29
MAPKKKKKAVVNPARGFATVSIPSKTRQADVAETPVSSDLSTPAEIADAAHIAQSQAQQSAPDVRDADLLVMRPEQLEEYLENAELQGLLESSSVKCKADASRQVTRLRTEIRQLRSKAMTLSTFGWLDAPTIDRVLSCKDTETKPISKASSMLQNGDHELLKDFWILHRVLSDLNLPRIDDAISHLIRKGLQKLIPQGEEHVWGLSTVLDWYASNFQPKDLPSYQNLSQSQSGDNRLLPSAVENGKSCSI